MAIRKYKPTSPGLRQMRTVNNPEVSKEGPEKSLSTGKNKSGGRNNKGRITCRHRGGGNKKKYRMVDFKRDKSEIPAKVARIEYDPNRSANLALLHYVDGEKRYILCPSGLHVGDMVISSDKADIKPGNTLTLMKIPVGSTIHNIEMKPGKGGQLVRSAGSSAQLLGKDKGMISLKIPSGEIRLVSEHCKATVGAVGNSEHNKTVIGKAGKTRWLGVRPTVRGVVMNPVDHPHGGGEGRTSGGRHPVTPWGVPTKGYRTRKKSLKSDKFIVRRRAK